MDKVCFVPAEGKTNRYVELMRRAVTAAGYCLSESNSFSDVLHSDIVHFNWYEGIPQGKWAAVSTYVKKMAVLWFLKLSGKRIVFTFHNKVQHEKAGGGLSKRIMKWLIRNSDGIVLHCEASRQALLEVVPDVDTQKAVFVPHPNYIGIYPDTKPYHGFEKQDGQLVFLFMGQVRPYKNVESVIEAANRLTDYPDIQFLICGRCSSEEYRQELLAKAASPNLHFDLRFIEDGEIPSLMGLADCVLLPYNTRSALNSGAAYLAFSYGKTVVSTEIGTITDMQQRGLVYGYHFSDCLEEDAENLKNAVLAVYGDYRTDPGAIEEKGQTLYRIMAQENSEEAIAEKLKQIYQ